MKIEHITLGSYYVNTYFLQDEKSRTCIVVDPGGRGGEIGEYLQKNGLTPVMIINTHGHVDHVEANVPLKKKFDIPVLMHPEDAGLFDLPIDRPMPDGEKIEFAGETLTVFSTPGHTPGSVCIQGEGFVLTGDTLFAGSIGRTDLGGSEEAMLETLASRFDGIADGMVLYPGHGPATTMGQERKQNMYLRMAKQGLMPI
jgi:glyoxylase-like metal-dependent hydrolase (beta-lactamase superfamily II)